MSTKRIIGIVLMVLGIASLFVSNYITEQVKEGNLKIARGQKSVDQGNKLFSMTPATKEIGKGVTGSAQRKIDSGREQVRDYEAIAQRLFIGGIIVIVLGAGTFAVSFMDGNNKKSR